jgi:hypothetical protein
MKLNKIDINPVDPSTLEHSIGTSSTSNIPISWIKKYFNPKSLKDQGFL